MSLRRIVGPPSTAIRTIRSYIGAKPRAHFRRHPTNCSLRLPRTTYTPARKLYLQHSNISYTTVGIVLVLSLGGAYFTYQASRDPTSHQDSSPQVSSVTVDNNIAISLYEMAASIPPGRPETLTEEQEQKLREFWSLVLRVFGVVVVEANGAPEQDAATTGPGTPAEPAAEATEKKKKRLGLFRKKEDKEKKKEKEAGKSEKPVAETTNLDSITDADDKYGQNKEFKAAMASKSPEELRAALWAMAKHDNPDGLLLRFLRARKWNPHPALVMLISTMHWRAEEMKVDSDIVLNGEETMIAESAENKDAADFMTQLRMGKSFLHGHDKEGRPMCIVRVRLHHGGEQTEKSLERFTVWTIETARMILRGPVDTATIVFDMSNFSMANMDYTPVRFMIKCFEANYPESLGAVLVHKSPWLFQGIWAIIRGWLDPVVASKVHFTSNTSELAEFIDSKQIPTELGGEEKWDYSYIEPVAGENALMKDTATRDRLQAERAQLVEAFEAKTVEWIDGDASEEVKKERQKLAEQLRENYWKLDPYIRARTLYDRTGFLKPETASGGATSITTESQPPPAQTTDADLD